MRTFLTSMLGTLAGLLLFVFGGFILLVMTVGALGALAKGKKAPSVESNSYLVVNLDMNITDAPPEWNGGFASALMGGNKGPKTLQLRELVAAIDRAAKDSAIRGIYIEGNLAPNGYGTGAAALKEFRNALEHFKTSGKPILSYVNFANQRDVYVASVADEVVMDPYGALVFSGLASEPMFMAGAFEKFGVGVQVSRVGKFKSAIEPYTRKDMSDASREQLQQLLSSIWSDIRAEVAASRSTTPEALQAVVDEQGLINPAAALKAKLVTRVQYRDEVIAELKAKTGVKSVTDSFKQIDIASYVKLLPDRLARGPGEFVPKGERIAVIYAEGAIVEGSGENGQVGGESYVDAIARFREDPDVKAIVLRVNSPGGSVGASEHIQRELRLAQKVKPVVVSMGTYAASGGYWISAYGDRIFAQKDTITGSIGVFGVQFDLEKLAGNLGFTFDRVKTGAKADMLTISRPKTAEEMQVFQNMVNWIYGEFVGKVSEGRHLDRARVDEIAQGRVWSGSDALKLGLVDEIGGLNDAIAWTVKKANLASGTAIEEFPRRKGLNEWIAEIVQQSDQGEGRASGLSVSVANRLKSELHSLDEYNDAKGLYSRIPYEIGF